jgi:hypothetical protein
MRKITLPALIIIVLLSGCAKKLTSTYRNHAENFSSDINHYQYDSDAGVMYLISNNKDSLFIDLKFPEITTAAKVLRSGLTVWVDPKAKKNKTYGVRFPLIDKRKQPDKMSRKTVALPEVVEGEDGFQHLRYPEKKEKRFFPDFQKADLRVAQIGFGEDSNPTSLLLTDLDLDLYPDSSQMLHYHLGLALEQIGLKKNIAAQTVSIGIETGAITRPQQRPDAGNRSFKGRGGGMQPGGQMGGSRGKMGNGDRSGGMPQAAMTPLKLWFKTVVLPVE